MTFMSVIDGTSGVSMVNLCDQTHRETFVEKYDTVTVPSGEGQDVRKDLPYSILGRPLFSDEMCPQMSFFM